MKKSGEVSPARAAKLLGVHVKTVRQWARAAVTGANSRLRAARQEVTGYYWIPMSEVRRLKSLEKWAGEVGSFR